MKEKLSKLSPFDCKLDETGGKKCVKNINFKIGCLIFTIISIMAAYGCAAENNENLTVSDDITTEVSSCEYEEVFFYKENNENDMSTYEQAIDYFGEDFVNNYRHSRAIADEIEDVFLIGSPPDFFGGMYFNDDGHLVVQIVRSYIANPSYEYTIFRNHLSANDVTIEYADFSHRELLRIMSRLDILFVADDRPQVFNNVSSIGLGTNSIRVSLIIYNEEEIALFREAVLDSPAIVFTESTGWAAPLLLDGYE